MLDKIKQYAKENDMNINTAAILLLERGLGFNGQQRKASSQTYSNRQEIVDELKKIILGEKCPSTQIQMDGSGHVFSLSMVSTRNCPIHGPCPLLVKNHGASTIDPVDHFAGEAFFCEECGDVKIVAASNGCITHGSARRVAP